MLTITLQPRAEPPAEVPWRARSIRRQHRVDVSGGRHQAIGSQRLSNGHTDPLSGTGNNGRPYRVTPQWVLLEDRTLAGNRQPDINGRPDSRLQFAAQKADALTAIFA